jgi:hypothetical protein
VLFLGTFNLVWMLGNLARATYVGSSDFVWPYSYNQCSADKRASQEINACSKVNHFGLDSYRGRGAPEIDLIESMQGESGKLPNTHVQRPYQSASLQIAPGIEIDRPVLGKLPHKVRALSFPSLSNLGETCSNDIVYSLLFVMMLQGHWYDHLEYGNETGSELNPFFYGVTLVHELKSHTYQADALSANMPLKHTHYEKQHIYRVEWDPPAEDGTGGYVKWYSDGKLVYGVSGISLDIMQTEIPSEPMYLLMNTAVSSNWGFPAPCPENCDCECYECGNPECACALPTGYCDNYPAAFEIDYVRVYQAVNESKHILGCSPESRPTATFIEGHAEKFMSEGQKLPLQPVQTGGAACVSSKGCGGINRGTCSSSGSCSCIEGWSGPRCLAHAAFYDVDSSKPIPIFYCKFADSRRAKSSALHFATGLTKHHFLFQWPRWKSPKAYS